MNLADEIRALKYGAKWTHQPTLDIVVDIVERREYERGVSLIELINNSDSKDPFFVGWNCAIKKVLDMEAKQ